MEIKMGTARGASSRAVIVKTIDPIINHLQEDGNRFCKISSKKWLNRGKISKICLKFRLRVAKMNFMRWF
jgi:hypothetical protein